MKTKLIDIPDETPDLYFWLGADGHMQDMTEEEFLMKTEGLDEDELSDDTTDRFFEENGYN